MSQNKVFIDKDVLLDIIKQDREFHKPSSELFLIFCDDNRSELYTSSHFIIEIIDYLTPLYSEKKVLSFVDKLLVSIRLLPFGTSEIKASRKLMKKNEAISFNTALSYIILKNNNCNTIMTRESFYYQTHNLKIINPLKLIDRN